MFIKLQHLPSTIRFILKGLSALILAGSLHAIDLAKGDGSAYEGEIACTAAKTVFLEDASARLTLLKKRDLDATSLAAVEAWEAQHPTLTELATKFDREPKVVRKRIPKRRELGGVKSAVIMFALVIDEAGGVEEVLVKDASDERIVDPTRAALSAWEFAPLEVESTPRRGVIFMPLQF